MSQLRDHSGARWILIACAFAVQVIAIIVAVPLLHLHFEAFRAALIILAAGTGISFWLSRKDRAASIHTWQHWIPALLYAGFIFTLSNHPFRGARLPFNPNCFHPVEYGFLGFFLGWAWYFAYRGRNDFLWAGLVLTSGILYGASDELHQSFVPGRDPSFGDLCLDALGLLLGIVLFLVAKRLLFSQRPGGRPENDPDHGMCIDS
jgi:hypothetical protein